MSAYRTMPCNRVKGEYFCIEGWESINRQIQSSLSAIPGDKKILVVETYQGVFIEEVLEGLLVGLQLESLINTSYLMLSPEQVAELVYPDVTDDRVFGVMTQLIIDRYFDHGKVKTFQNDFNKKDGLHVIIGPGAAYVVPNPDILVYADMPRWEIQKRMRNHQVSNLGVENNDTPDWMLLYKQGLFVDWKVCDRHKKQLIEKWNFVLDTTTPGSPKMVTGEALREALRQAVTRPFSIVPFFDPGPWGGQWMKEKCNLDKDASNYAWCFNCVPEEESLLLTFNDVIFEIPSVNLVYYRPQQLLGEKVYERFGDEFPIRFDFLDTMEGGHLSLQVHPTTQYIKENFGMPYTQDESYYLMDAAPDAVVYLGLKEEIHPAAMIADLEKAQKESIEFEVEKHVQSWPAKKHDHFLIPAGTVHCSGKNSMVLEISATPFIFTFKLYDWGRVGLDGKPRPINIEHGKKNIYWQRTTSWTKSNLVNAITRVAEGDGWTEEHTGLHELEFIETRRHWFTKKVNHNTQQGVNVICLVEGDTVVVESPINAFDPFEVHYAETFIVPAEVGEYTITPCGHSTRYATMKAFVRT